MKFFVCLVAVFALVLAQDTPKQREEVLCIMCELGVRVAAPMLGKDTLDIENEFVKECKDILKIPFAAKTCRDFANKELGAIIRELESGTAPKDVCTKLDMCAKH